MLGAIDLSTATLLPILIALVIICLIVWLIRALR